MDSERAIRAIAYIRYKYRKGLEGPSIIASRAARARGSSVSERERGRGAAATFGGAMGARGAQSKEGGQ
ncbi:unnamed protein product [Trichogramma brassicae]|uniref:Uncharacterized protein n=1 Tax=Trichogramma brassicae TaxID=86971 RepID=A0A6H5IDY7_9HYME|nr:unnamed protein product [Trichogramma brassicae]